MNAWSMGVVAAAVLGLNACVANEPTPAAAPTPAGSAAAPAGPGPAGRQFDGAYTGLINLGTPFGGASASCMGSPNAQTLRVVNGNLRGAIFGRQFSGPLGADGSVNLTGTQGSGSGLPGTLQARFTATGVEGTYSQPVGIRTRCDYSLSNLRKG